jgi:hypothetical protein
MDDVPKKYWTAFLPGSRLDMDREEELRAMPLVRRWESAGARCDSMEIGTYAT